MTMMMILLVLSCYFLLFFTTTIIITTTSFTLETVFMNTMFRQQSSRHRATSSVSYHYDPLRIIINEQQQKKSLAVTKLSSSSSSSSSSTTTTTTTTNTAIITEDDVMEMDVVLFSFHTNDDTSSSLKQQQQEEIYQFGAIIKHGGINCVAPLCVWSMEPAFDNSIECLMNEIDHPIGGYSISNTNNNHNTVIVRIHSIIEQEYISYGSRQVNGGMGPGNPHGEESEVLYYLDINSIVQQYINDNNSNVQIALPPIKPELEIFW